MDGQHEQDGSADRQSAADGLLLGSARVLWPEGAILTRDRRPRAGTSDWLVLPTVSAPRWLVPAAAPGTAAALEGQETSVVHRVGARALAAAHRRGLLGRLPVRRVRATDAGSLVVAVQDVVGEPADVAVRLGRWQHPRTVVLRVLRPDGSTLAFGKLGIDGAGRAAVRAETAALERVGGLGLRRVVHSRVLHRDVWRGLDLLLVSPLLADRGGDERQARPADAMVELAAAGGRAAPLADSRWWVRTRQRLAEVDDRDVRGELARHLDAVTGAAGATPVRLGPCHGDWTAWNMVRDGDRVLLWDWEHFGEDVPAGFDAAHYLAQELRVRTGTGAAQERAWIDRAHAALRADLGLAAAERDVVLAAYLLDVNLRFVLDRQGTPLASVAREGWGLTLLRRLASRLPETPDGTPERTQNG